MGVGNPVWRKVKSDNLTLLTGWIPPLLTTDTVALLIRGKGQIKINELTTIPNLGLNSKAHSENYDGNVFTHSKTIFLSLLTINLN